MQDGEKELRIIDSQMLAELNLIRVFKGKNGEGTQKKIHGQHGRKKKTACAEE